MGSEGSVVHAVVLLRVEADLGGLDGCSQRLLQSCLGWGKDHPCEHSPAAFRCPGFRALARCLCSCKTLCVCVCVHASMQVVDASWNKLRSCPQDLLGCINNLLVLNLSYNRLDRWPAGLHMPALVVLDLSFNRLQQLPADMGQQMPSLQDLYMANNYLTGLPDSLARLELRDLFVSENNFQLVPKVGGGRGCLQEDLAA